MAVAPILVAYFTAWSIYGRSYFVANIPGDKLTHINYAYANIDSNGHITLGDLWADTEQIFDGDKSDQPLRGNFNQLIKLKQKYPHLRTLISVGGWSWSGRFSDVAENPASRTEFAASCVKFIQKYGFDGIDLDWEYPVRGGMPENIRRPEDKQNFVLLLKEIRRQLDSTSNKRYLLTVATGSGTERIADLNLPGMIAYVDWINVMTYDFHGTWDQRTGHNAPLYKNNAELVPDIAPSFTKSKYNCHAAIQGYITAGAPREKLIMGMPLYGRGWQGVTNTAQNGFSQLTSKGLPPGTWEKGIFDYDHLEKSFIPSYTRYWDDQSKVPFLFNSSTGIWISYDDLKSFKYKNNYIRKERLGGAMFWELSGDRQAKLIDATYNSLNTILVPPSTSPSNDKVHRWKAQMKYKVGDRVIYEGNIYQCIKAHKSSLNKPPIVTVSLWRSQFTPTSGGGDNASSQCNCKSKECCSKWGFCGTSIGYCGIGCQSGPCSLDGGHNHTSQCNCRSNECCSKWNFCGITNEYCGDGCQSGPCLSGGGHATSFQCNSCRSNECCSKWGFCGTTNEHCGVGCQSGLCFSSSTSTHISNDSNPRQWYAQVLYAMNDLVTYNGITYRCRLAHTSVSNWMPPAVPELWYRV